MSSNTFKTGAKQLVVQLAALMIDSVPSNILSLTPYTIVFKFPFAGAEIITCLAPALICASLFSSLVNNPVHSKTKSIPNSPQGKL